MNETCAISPLGARARACVLDGRVAAEPGGDAGELVPADHHHLEGADVGETVRQVRQVVLMQEQGDQLLQPVNTQTHTHTLS